MSIEAFLMVNLAADFMLLATVSRTMGLFNWRRVIAADLLCALLASLAALRPGCNSCVAIASPLLASLIIAAHAAPGMWAFLSLALTGHALLCGGIARLVCASLPLAAALSLGIGAALSCVLSIGRPPACCDWRVALSLTNGKRQVRFPALIDTGNRLREPLSGLPVLIVERQLLQGILPECGYRILGFGGLGGEGQMACFKPDAVWIGSGRARRRGPDVWVAVSPHPLPGLCQALAPPEFALYRS